MNSNKDMVATEPVAEPIAPWIASQRVLTVKHRGISKRVRAKEKPVDEVTQTTERRLLPAEALKLVDEERRRIGQDLHDVLGQELTGLALVADALRQRASIEIELATKIKTGIKRLLRYVRAESWGLIPEEIAVDGLVFALETLASRVSEQFGVECQFDCLDSVVMESSATATHLYRIAQEAVTNAIKHGNARRVCIRLGADQDPFWLCIQDDGIGLPKQRSDRMGLGIQIMGSRAELIHATFRIEQIENGGVQVTCRANRKTP